MVLAVLQTDTLKIKRNLSLLIGILICCELYTRFKNLSHPASVVFDEVHCGSICSLYFKQIFHYDKQPPLFRIFICSLVPENLKNAESWTHIGQEISSIYDLTFLRFFPVIFSVLLIPLVFDIVLALKFSYFAASLAAFYVAFDNGFVVQSKMLVSDSFQHLLLALSLRAALYDSAVMYVTSHVFFGLAISVNSSCVSLLFVFICLATYKSWQYFTDITFSLYASFLRGTFAFLSVFFTPFLVYSLVIMLHIFLTPHSGPHDSLMSSAFQASLVTGLKTEDEVVKYGSNIRLRAEGDLPPYGMCYLSSQSQIYPLQYDDGRGSSAQQVVSCCHLPTAASVWKVVHPMPMLENHGYVKHGDIVSLVHLDDNKPLNTHDVAGPLSKYRQEVSCYIDYNASFPTNFEWKVGIFGRSNGDEWQNLHSQITLLHVNTDAFLSSSGAPLPQWGSGCLEVVADHRNNLEIPLTLWNAEILPDEESKQKPFLFNSLNYMEMTVEYMKKSMYLGRGNRGDHRFASNWYEWPLARSNIAYWFDDTSKAELHFTGNVISWAGGLLVCASFLVYFALLTIFKQIKIFYTSHEIYYEIRFCILFLSGLWISNLSYFALSDETPLFIYQYLPCTVYLHIMQACALSVFCSIGGKFACAITLLYCVIVLIFYWILKPLSYGFSSACTPGLEIFKTWLLWEGL